MPRIQLLRRDSSVIELDASDITIGLNRLALTYPIPILATRMGLDLNQTDVEIVLSGIIVDDEEATLKRFRRKGASIALEAANPAYETRIFGPDRVKVQGKLVGLIRRYH